MLCLGFARLAWNTRAFLAGFFIFSFLTVCPGYYFRPHYFICLLPAVTLLAGLAVSASGQWLARRKKSPWLRYLPFGLAAIACAQSLYADHAVYFSLSPREACKAVYANSAFPEAIDIARYIEQNTRQDQPIAVIGSEPEIYFYAHRHSSTSYIYTYPLRESQPFALKMQEEMTRQIGQNPPAYLVFISDPDSWWNGKPGSSDVLNDWVIGYVNTNMQLVGLVQYTRPHPTDTVWGTNAETTPLTAQTFISVFKSADSAGVVRHYDEALTLRAYTEEAYNNIGCDLARKGRFAEAIVQFQQANRLNPNSAETRCNLGMALRSQGLTSQAIEQFEESIRLNPDFALAHYQPGMALGSEGQLDEAIHQLQETLRLDPDNATARNILARALQIHNAPSAHRISIVRRRQKQPTKPL
jgi:tetratricopeptide (TPR) repeat protein